MAKRSPSKKHRPRNNPSSRRRSPSNQSKPGLITKGRALLVALLAGAGLATWHFGFNKPEEKNQDNPAIEQSNNDTERREPPSASHNLNLDRYNEWASKIVLPTTNISNTPGVLMDSGLSADKLQSFSVYFESLAIKFGQDFNRESNNSEAARKRLIYNFIGHLIDQYHLMVFGKKTNDKLQVGGKEFVIKMHKVNAILVHLGHYVHVTATKIAEQNGKELFETRISNYKAQVVDNISLDGSGVSSSTPIIALSNQKDYATKSGKINNKNMLINAQYNKYSNFIIHHKAGSIASLRHNARVSNGRMAKYGRSFSLDHIEQLSENATEVARSHEALHAWMHKAGFEPDASRTDVKDKGIISMGSYQLSGNQYLSMDNANIHELASVGYGFSKMNNVELIVPSIIGVLAGTSPNYRFARQILSKEAYEAIDEIYKQKVVTKVPGKRGQMDIAMLTYALSNVPLEKLQQIGERMAKLGLYLMKD